MLFVNLSSQQMIGICFACMVSSFETLGWFCDWRFQYCNNLINLAWFWRIQSLKCHLVDTIWLAFVFSLWSVHGHRLPTGCILAWGLARVIDLLWAWFILEGRWSGKAGSFPWKKRLYHLILFFQSFHSAITLKYEITGGESLKGRSTQKFCIIKLESKDFETQWWKF